MTHILLAVIYLAFISLGLPDSLLWAPPGRPCTGELGVPVSRAGMVSMIICFRDHHIQPPEQPGSPAGSAREGDGCQCGGHGSGSPGIFRKPFLLAALSLGSSLRAGSRKRGRSPQPLCGPSLQKPPYELAPLYVGRGRSWARRSWGRSLREDMAGAWATGPWAWPRRCWRRSWS